MNEMECKAIERIVVEPNTNLDEYDPIVEYVCVNEDGDRTPIEPDELLIHIFQKLITTCEKVEKIQEDFEEFKADYDWDVGWEISGRTCEDDDEYDDNAVPGEGTGFRALIALHMATFARIDQLMTAICNIENSYSVPEHWQIPVEAHRPQLIINMAPRINEKKFEPAKWRITIPHFAGRIDTPPPFDYMDKGHIQGTEILNDGSKIFCYVETEAEADRILDACLKVVNPFFAINSQRKYTIHKPEDFQEVRMYPRRGTFWPFGKKTGNPDWTINYPNPEDNI